MRHRSGEVVAPRRARTSREQPLGESTRSTTRHGEENRPPAGTRHPWRSAGAALALGCGGDSNNCAPVSDANVEIWQCDAAGNYSQYGTQHAETYLRGIQTTNGNGEVTFTTVCPGWYQARATHIHVEVVRNGASVKVTQIAFPESINAAVYGTGVYASRGANPTSNTRDGIFADSIDSDLATVSGNPATGLAATFRFAVAV